MGHYKPIWNKNEKILFLMPTEHQLDENNLIREHYQLGQGNIFLPLIFTTWAAFNGLLTYFVSSVFK